MEPLAGADAFELDALLRDRLRLVVRLTPLMVLFNCLDWAQYPEFAVAWLGYRSATVGILVFVVHPIVRRFSGDSPFPQLLAYVVGISACLALMMYESGGFESPYYVVLVLICWAFSVIAPLEMRRAFAIGSVILIAYLLAGAMGGGSLSRDVVFEGMAMMGALLFTVLGSHLASRLYLRQRRAEREAQQLIRQLEETSRRDPLTGILNRLALDERLAVEFARLERQGTPFCFVMLDLDRFKEVNDRFGHPAGDRVLLRVGRELERQLRTGDELFRIGGEEFGAVLAGSELAESRIAAERLRRAVETLHVEVNGRRLGFTVSAGVTEAVPTDGIASLTERADSALYRAKANGRNRVEYAVAAPALVAADRRR